MRLVALLWLLLVANSIYLPVIMPGKGEGGGTLPTSAPTLTPTATQTPTATATVQVAICGCDGDLYNCADFDTQPEAQGCFDYCRSLGKGDVHQLDTDDDLVACESLPPLWKVMD